MRRLSLWFADCLFAVKTCGSFCVKLCTARTCPLGPWKTRLKRQHAPRPVILYHFLLLPTPNFKDFCFSQPRLLLLQLQAN